ncbi:MAG: hypothetical protein ACRD2O_05470 [Terriglobia bacterium]
MPRMKTLNTAEQEAFESPPVFNSVQRKPYFHFPLPIQQAAASLRTPTHQLCFLLSCGYFKASASSPSGRSVLGMTSMWLSGRASGWRRLNSIATTSKPCGDIAR